MLPKVFLSLSGGDEKFVASVQRSLPDGLAFFYPESFESGEHLVAAMEDRIDRSTIFVLFASKRSLSSYWCKFEIERARVKKINDPRFRIIVVLIDSDVTYQDLPDWMRDYWIANIGVGARDIARYIRRMLTTKYLAELPGAQVFGRGALVDRSMQQVADIVLRTEHSPNIFIFAGNTGIGRRTFSRSLLANAFPSWPSINYGPEFLLPQFADLADLYRALRQETVAGIELSEALVDFKAFSNADMSQQIDEILLLLTHFSHLHQAVTIVSGSGIFDDLGYLKPWAAELFRRLSNLRTTTMAIVTNRRLQERELRAHANLLQIAVPPLQDGDIRTLMIGAAAIFGAKPELPSPEVIRTIGGHPGIARATAALVARKGPAAITSNPADLYTLQEDILEESLDFNRLTDVEKDILSILSWVPQLPGDILRQIIVERHTIEAAIFGSTVSDLILACLVEVSGPNYLIMRPVRYLFRRLHGYGSPELIKIFSSALRAEWERARENNELRADLLDALTYMTAIEGGSLPDELRQLLLPSTLQEVIHDTYDQGHEDPDSLKRVVDWGLVAIDWKMDETTREEILSYVIRAMVRLKDYAEADKLLKLFESRRYRSYYYLRAFYARHHDGNNTYEIIDFLKKAKEIGKYAKQVVGDLARIYQRMGEWRLLHDLIKDQDRYISRNPVLLDVKIGMLIAQGDFAEAQRLINVLNSIPRQEVYAEGRRAMLLMRQDQDFRSAKRILTDLINKNATPQSYLRRLRAIAAASDHDIALARSDVAFLRARGEGLGLSGIDARIKLAEGDLNGAIQLLSNSANSSAPDQLLRARILEAKANHPNTPFSDRMSLLDEATVIRSKNRMLDEYELER